jgi:hypothetical protein
MTDDIIPTEPIPLAPDELLAADPRLAGFLDALRGPATAAELSGEASTVAMMAAAIAPAPVAVLKDRRTMKNRMVRVAAIAAVGVLSAGGAAAAAVGANPLGPLFADGDSRSHLEVEVSTTTSSTTTSTTTTIHPTTTTASATTTTVVTVNGVPVDCDANHGDLVSAIAQQDHSLDGDDNHGALVSEWAHTQRECQRAERLNGDDPESDEPESEDAEKQDKPEKPEKDNSDHGNHNGSGGQDSEADGS